MESHYYYPHIVLALLSLLIVFPKLIRRRGHGLRLPPGPWQLPVIGSIHHIAGKLPHHAMRDLARRHGPVMLLHIGEVPTVVLSSREAAREVMKTHDMVFATRPMSPTINAITNGGRDIVFGPYGELWRQLRKIAVVELLNTRRVLSFRHIREEEVAVLLRDIAFSAAESRPIQMRHRLGAFPSDVTVRAVIGDRWKDRDVFLHQIQCFNEVACGFNPCDLWPSSKVARWLSSAERRAREGRRTVFRILDDIVKEHQQRLDSTAAGKGEVLLDLLLKIQRDGGLEIPLDMDLVKSLVFDMFDGGSETAATVLEWAMAELIRNPRAMQRATAEVRNIFSVHSTVPEHALGELRYLHLVIRETLRLHPPLALLLPREAREPCRVLGYDVLPGTTVIVNAWALGRDERYWPGDPEEFRPERFEDSEVDFKGADFEFLPFGAGRRMCPGLMFGLANVELPLANLLFHFDWEAPGVADLAEFDMTEVFGVTVRRKSGLLLRPILRVPLPSV